MTDDTTCTYMVILLVSVYMVICLPPLVSVLCVDVGSYLLDEKEQVKDGLLNDADKK